MHDARSLYLGYSNSTRKAIAINGHDVVVLTRGTRYTVLEGEQAREFVKVTSAITAHVRSGVVGEDREHD